MTDSKELWLSIRQKLPQQTISLGPATTQAYLTDPRMLAFIASRYKFVSKMLVGINTALEVGCGDAFGAPIVAQSVSYLTCTDIDEEMIESNTQRLKQFPINFQYFDFRKSSHPLRFEAIYLIDVLEHIYPSEEQTFITNLMNSLTSTGFILIGTPNKASEQYASVHSKAGHVNLKTKGELRHLLSTYCRNVFMFSMNDEVVHTGYSPMAQYLWGLGIK